MTCTAVVHQPRVRHEVVRRVSPAHVCATSIPAGTAAPALHAGVMLSSNVCVTPTPLAWVAPFSDTGPVRPTQLTGSAVIVALVQEFKTTNRHILHIDSIIFKTALALFVAFTFSPFLVLLITLLAPGRRSEAEVKEQQERLGTGPTAKKVGVIAVATSLLLWELVSPFSRDPKHSCRKLTRGGVNRSFGSSRSCRLTLHHLRLGTLYAPPNRCFSILQNQFSGSRGGNMCIGTTVSRRFTSSFPCSRSSCLSCMRSRGWTDCSTR